jgi:hypothetical protein
VLQDRATALFNAAIQIPPLKVSAEFKLHEGPSGRWVYASPDAREKEVIVPPDFYLQEVHEVDYEDDGSLATFIEAWGIPVDVMSRDTPGGPLDVWKELGRIAGDAGLSLEDGREAAAIELGWVRERPRGPATTLATRIAAERDLFDPDRLAKVGRLVNWEEVRMRVMGMQWIAGEVTSTGHSEDLADALENLNAALFVFAPRVTPRDAVPPRATIYNVFAAQIANDIYEGTTLMKCQNERCPKTFTKQRGRADYGSHRTKGVLYCSNSCAKAVAQRALRLRRRIAKNDA